MLDQESLCILHLCDAAIVMRDEKQEPNEELSLIYHALLPEAVFLVIKLDTLRTHAKSQAYIIMWAHQKILKDFRESNWSTRSTVIVYTSNSFRVI